MEPTEERAEPERRPSPGDATLERLDYLIDWYRSHAQRERWAHKGLKIVSISAAAAVPVLVAVSGEAWAVASLGAIVVVVEALQELFQWQTNAVAFARTKELLIREQALYRAEAGRYEKAKDPERLLAVRIEALVAEELDAWVAGQLAERSAAQ
jgi:hypothetical protein